MNNDQRTKFKAFAATANWSMLPKYAVDEQDAHARLVMGGVLAIPRRGFALCKKILMTMMLVPLMAMALEINPSFTPEAVAKYKEKADAGDAETQYLYARALCNGEGVKKDKSAAFEYAKKSADQGYGLSYFEVGTGYAQGWNGSKNDVESVKWYGKFVEWAKPEAEKGNVWAQCNLGRCYENGCGVGKDEKETLKWYRKAAELGNAKAMFFLGLRYNFGGGGVEKNLQEGLKWYRMAAEHGDIDAMCFLGDELWIEGKQGDENALEESVKWCRILAEKGNQLAKERLSDIAKYKGVSVEDLAWLFGKHKGVNGDKVMEIKKKSEAMKKDTLVFKGMHLGMSVEDARYVIQSFGGSVTSEMLDTKSGKVNAFKFKRIVIDRMFKTEGVSSEAFCKSLLSAYPIIEKLETKYETIADVERQKKYKQDAENAAMRTFANMASNGQDAYELGAAIGSKIRMNANQMTKEVPYYYFESPKGFVLEIHPDRSEMFFVLRSIAAIDTSNFD